jgi:hypothetical protein
MDITLILELALPLYSYFSSILRNLHLGILGWCHWKFGSFVTKYQEGGS